jgi:hypothetical protein
MRDSNPSKKGYLRTSRVPRKLKPKGLSRHDPFLVLHAASIGFEVYWIGSRFVNIVICIVAFGERLFLCCDAREWVDATTLSIEGVCMYVTECENGRLHVVRH